MTHQGRKIAILGATGGIGAALSRQLAERGATLVLGARGRERLEALADELNAFARPVDARDFDLVDGFFRGACEDAGALDGVVNCVGSILLKPAHRTSFEDYEDTLRTNLHTAFATVRSAVGAFGEHGGSIVLLSTAAARTGIPNHEAIAAAKAGVEGVARSAAATYAGKGIRVNCIAPGLVDTPQSAAITGNGIALQASLAMHPLGRIGTADDVASAIVWLLDSSQTWVTGQIIGIDGGLAHLRGKAGARPATRREKPA